MEAVVTVAVVTVAVVTVAVAMEAVDTETGVEVMATIPTAAATKNTELFSPPFVIVTFD